ncbi:glycoside hydrolase superfamily [Mycena olivaceomarginata]|nr:glycoside hydrolase superfamily [Mycena olivaceomarginata]
MLPFFPTTGDSPTPETLPCPSDFLLPPPFPPKTSARKYGILVNLDLHTAPGSQNGYNHSGKVGQINSLNGVLGYATGQCMLDYMRIVVESISQPEYEDLIPMFSIVNEALARRRNYLQACNMMRGITGYGAGNGPFISIHDGFQGTPWWTGSRPPPPPSSDRIILHMHPYFAFDGAPNDSPIATSADPLGAGPKQACSLRGSSLNTNGRGKGRMWRYDCLFWMEMDADFFFNPAGARSGCRSRVETARCSRTRAHGPTPPKLAPSSFALASMDTPRDWFFSIRKIGPALDGVTGGAGTETIAPTAVQSFGQWPPATLSNVDLSATLLPTHIATASTAIMTFVTPVAGYTYLDTWKAIGSPVPGEYGFTIFNDLQRTLSLYLFYFDAADYSIRTWYEPATASSSLGHQNQVPIGHGNGGKPFICNRRGRLVDTGFLMVFISTKYLEMAG